MLLGMTDAGCGTACCLALVSALTLDFFCFFAVGAVPMGSVASCLVCVLLPLAFFFFVVPAAADVAAAAAAAAATAAPPMFSVLTGEVCLESLRSAGSKDEKDEKDEKVFFEYETADLFDAPLR